MLVYCSLAEQYHTSIFTLSEQGLGDEIIDYLILRDIPFFCTECLTYKFNLKKSRYVRIDLKTMTLMYAKSPRYVSSS